MEEDKKQVLNLLKTARGQLDGIIRMVEEDRYCIDISKQLLAVQALLKKSNLQVLRQHIYRCVRNALINGEGEEKIEEIIMILDKYMK
ncbi:metal-sensing transcriptional repressor [Defluviitalea phaphyphila]|uniref:metal-sensing transcriptional repressor n=1 Tax=Defluviitalea phaphyphila TaxID=1473580 RepID=UPI000730B8D3